jgi:hypothetical protein
MEAPANLSNTEIQNFLIRRLGEKEADEIMEYVNTEVDKRVSEKVDASRKEITLWRDEMKNVFASKEDAAKLEKKLVKRVSAVEGTIILWSFVFWITLIIAMVIILKFMK